ncbi:YczE/YyaS/YitT family protein [Fredinandcohnia humi]
MIIRRILFYSIGLFILSLGISLMIKADIGAGAWDALNVGLSETFGLTVGNWVIIVGSIVMLVNALLLMVRPAFLAIGTIVLIGFFIDFWMLFIFNNLLPVGFLLKLVIFIVGLVIASIGIAAYLQAKFPLSPLDNLMLAISKRFKLKVGIAKTIAELTGLLLAFIFHGPIGIGTLLCTIGIGPVIQFFFPFFERLYASGSKASTE